MFTIGIIAAILVGTLALVALVILVALATIWERSEDDEWQ